MKLPGNFEALRMLHSACLYGACSWSVSYDESSDNWSFDITSAAPVEDFHIKKTADFDEGVARCLAHLSLFGYVRA